MPDRDIIHGYLKSLAKYLSRLENADADDVIREIESHIYDALETREKEGAENSAEVVLAGFGLPRELAAQYVDHILEGAAPPAGFKAIQRVKKGATKGLYFATAVFGYGMSLVSTLVGIYKLLEPEMVGFWVSENKTLVLGVMSKTPEGTREIFGWWAVPLLIGLGIVAAYLTRRILSVLKETTWLRQSAGRR
jgi:uncharacterized membrane protein